MLPLLVALLAPAQPDDPLPAGAVFRAGTTRYRTSGFYPRVFFTANPDTLAVTNSGDRVRFMDVPTGRVVGELVLPGGEIREAAASAKGDRLAVLGTWQRNERAKKRPSVWLIDTAARKVLWRSDLPENDRAREWRVRVSADGKRVAAVIDGDLRIWDAGTAEELARFAERTRVEQFDLSPDGATVAFGYADGVLRLWRWETEDEPRAFGRTGGGPFAGVRFHPDGRSLLVFESREPEYRMWDVATGGKGDTRRLAFFSPALEFRPDGKALAVADRDDAPAPAGPAVGLIDHATGRGLVRLPMTGDQVHCVAWSADGGRVAAATGSRVHVWDATTHRPLGSAPPGHDGHVYEVAFLADGGLVTAGGDGTVRTWDSTGRPGMVLRPGLAQVRGLAVAPEGTLVAGYDMAGEVRVWDAKTGAEVAKAEAGGRQGGARRLAFTPDASRLLAVGRDATLRVIEARTGRVIVAHRLIPLDPAADERARIMEDLFAAILASTVAFSPDAMAVAYKVPTGVRVLDAKTGTVRCELSDGETPVERIAFSPDGKQLAVARHARQHAPRVNGVVRAGSEWTEDTHAVELWDVADGKKRWSVVSDGQLPNQITVTPDGALVAETATLGKDEKAIRLWDAATGADAGRLALPQRPGHFAFDRTGRRIAVAFRDTTAVVFDVAAVRVRP